EKKKKKKKKQKGEGGGRRKAQREPGLVRRFLFAISAAFQRSASVPRHARPLDYLASSA
ncbi:hypothetical protein ACFDR9_004006, partial [Janthinobacterium sp. CG_23.3]